VQSAAGDTLVTVFNNQADQTFTLPAKGRPTGVLIDPNNLILKTVISTSMVVTATEEPANSTLTVFPNPATDNLTIRFSSPKAGYTIINLFGLLGQTSLRFTGVPVKIGEQTLTIPLKGMPPGRYTLTLELPTGKRSVAVLIH